MEHGDEKKHPENETSPGMETLSSSSWSKYQNINKFCNQNIIIKIIIYNIQQ